MPLPLPRLLRLAFPLAGLLLLFATFAAVSPRDAGGGIVFLSRENLFNILLHSSVFAILGVGMTFVIVGGAVDLSVGSVLALAGMAGTWAMTRGAPPAVGAAAGVAAGAACGLLNGAVTVALRIPAFIATLGTLLVFRGAALVVNDGRPFEAGIPASFGALRNGTLLGVPNPVWILAAVALGAHAALAWTPFGRRCYATGGNREAARLAGIRVGGVTVATFAIAGALAGLGGMIEASQLQTGQPTAGEGYELAAIAAVVIGGGSLGGGAGGVAGTVIGAFLMSVLRNGCQQAGVSDFWQKILIGAVIIGAVALDEWRRRRA